MRALNDLAYNNNKTCDKNVHVDTSRQPTQNGFYVNFLPRKKCNMMVVMSHL